MRKQILSILLAVTMCTELLAGCATTGSTDTDIVFHPEESEAVPKSTTPMSTSEEIGEPAVIQTGSNGMVYGQVVNRMDGTGIPHARLTVYDSNGTPIEFKAPYVLNTKDVRGAAVVDEQTGQFIWDSTCDTYDYLVKEGEDSTVYVTDEIGNYYFQLPEPGTYYLQAEAEDFCKMESQIIEYYDKFYQNLDGVKQAFQAGVEQGFENGARMETLKGYREELRANTDKEKLETILKEAGASEEKLAGYMIEMEGSLQKAKEVMRKLDLMVGIDEKRTWKEFWEIIEAEPEKEKLIEVVYTVGPYPAIRFNEKYIDAWIGESKSNYVNYDTYWNEEGGKEAATKVAMEGARFLGEEAVENTVITAAGSSLPIIGTGMAAVGAWVKTGAKLVLKVTVKGYKFAKRAGLAEDVATRIAMRQRQIQKAVVDSTISKEKQIEILQKERDEMLNLAKGESPEGGAYLGHMALRYDILIEMKKRGIDVEIEICDVEKTQEAVEASRSLFLPAGNTYATQVKIPGMQVMEAAGITGEITKKNYAEAIVQFQEAAASQDMEALDKLVTTWGTKMAQQIRRGNQNEEVKALHESFYSTLVTVKKAFQPAKKGLQINKSIQVEAVETAIGQGDTLEALFDVKEAKELADGIYASSNVERSIQWMEGALAAMANGDMAKAKELFTASQNAASKGSQILSQSTENFAELQSALAALRNRAQYFQRNLNSSSMMREIGDKLTNTQNEINHARRLIYEEYSVALPMDYDTFLSNMRTAMQASHSTSRGNILEKTGKILARLEDYPELAGKGKEVLSAVENQHSYTLLWKLTERLKNDIGASRRNLNKIGYEPISPAGQAFDATGLEGVPLIRLPNGMDATFRRQEGRIYSLMENVNVTTRAISNPRLIDDLNYEQHRISNLVSAANTVSTKLTTYMNSNVSGIFIPSIGDIAKLTPKEALQKAGELDEAATKLMKQAATLRGFTRLALEKAQKQPAEALIDWGENIKGLTEQQIRERADELAEAFRKTMNKKLKEAYKTALDIRESQWECFAPVVKTYLDEAGEEAAKLLDEFEALGKSMEMSPMAKVIGTGGLVTYLAVFLNNRCEAIEADIPDPNNIVAAAENTLSIWRTMQEAELSLCCKKNVTPMQPITCFSGTILLSDGKTPVGDMQIKTRLLGENEEIIASYSQKLLLDKGDFLLTFEKEKEMRATRKIEMIVSKEGYETEIITIEKDIQQRKTISLGDILLMKKCITVSGRVVDQQGKALKGIRVYLYGNAPGSVLFVETGEKGEFCFERSIGYYELWVEDEWYEPADHEDACFDGRTMEEDTDLGDVVMKAKPILYPYTSPDIPQTTPSPKATATPTVIPSPKATATPAVTPSPKATATPTVIPSPKATVTPMATPNPKITPTPTSTLSPTPTVMSTPKPTPTVTPTPKITPSPTSAATPVVKPTVILTAGFTEGI